MDLLIPLAQGLVRVATRSLLNHRRHQPVVDWDDALALAVRAEFDGVLGQ